MSNCKWTEKTKNIIGNQGHIIFYITIPGFHNLQFSFINDG